jgi:hypothetical protein
VASWCAKPVVEHEAGDAREVSRVVSDDDGTNRQRVRRNHFVEIADGCAARLQVGAQIAVPRCRLRVPGQDGRDAQELLHDPVQPHSFGMPRDAGSKFGEGHCGNAPLARSQGLQ